MRLIHKVPFSTQEIETYRQLVFNNLTYGLRYVLEAMDEMELEVADDNAKYLEMMVEVTDLPDGEPFPMQYLEPLKALWADINVQKACSRGNEAALPEK
jgi:guanine nucleotide-binding protein subunit alpha